MAPGITTSAHDTAASELSSLVDSVASTSACPTDEPGHTSGLSELRSGAGEQAFQARGFEPFVAFGEEARTNTIEWGR